jgi:hypothetical protein
MVVPKDWRKFKANRSLLSPAYIDQARMSCRELLTQLMALALSLALDKAGKSIAAKIAMIAMTTSSSIRVKAR